MAETADALYVAFLGTKLPRDHLVNLRLACAPALPTAAAPQGLQGEGEGPAAAAAHSGYLARAAGVPAEQLLQLARVQGKRLVLAGARAGDPRVGDHGLAVV